ncbi:MAG: putative dehydrogenase [Ramlibacter sp.]|nr:putative dehydrogenase [Ramlibacter sp.]
MIETDVVVIGSGAAGLTAAITARQLGLEALVVEKTAFFGGTTAYSGGAPWIPCNHVMKQIGLDDSRAAAETYLRAVLGEAYNDDLVTSYLDNAPAMLKFLELHSDVCFKPFPLPDYESLPGAAKSRSLLTKEFDGRLLGERLADLRMPLPQLMLFGSMQVEGADIHPMRHALKTWAGFKHTAKVMRRFVLDKIRHGRGTRIVNGNALAARLFHSAIKAGVTLWKNTPALELIVDEKGTVRGVVVERDGQRIEVKARLGVLLATGGYGASDQMRAKYIPFAEHHYSLQPEGNVGDGIALGLQAGAVHDPKHAGDCIWTPVSVLRKPDGSVVKYPHIFIDRAMPGCIAVGPTGKRFINEGTSYQTFVGTMHDLGITKAHLIADRAFLRNYGLGLARPAPFSPAALIQNGYLMEAPTLAELARRIGVDPTQLEATVQKFNQGAQRGEDPDFGKGADAHSKFRGDQSRQPNPAIAPIGDGPYYAVAIHPGDLSTVGGLETNGRAQVLDTAGQPIPGLFAAGLDMNSMMRGRYPGGGSSIGPAMTFGYIAARQMAKSSAKVDQRALAEST